MNFVNALNHDGEEVGGVCVRGTQSTNISTNRPNTQKENE